MKNLNFHNNCVSGQELDANLSPAASRSTTNTPRHPKLAPQICFQALFGCLRPTTDSETLRKDPKLVFHFVKDKISSVNGDRYVNITDFSQGELKHMVGVFAESLSSIVKLFFYICILNKREQTQTIWIEKGCS